MVSLMTMPRTADVVTHIGKLPEVMTLQELERAMSALESDLPGTLPFLREVAEAAIAHGGRFTYVSRKPSQMSSKAAWTTLVGYLARLFASPFDRVVQAWAQERYGVELGFVNCCIVMAQADKLDQDERYALQVQQQLTPDC